jgi:hypothetical protein
MNRKAWHDPAALAARLRKAERQVWREELPWVCGLTLALALTLAGATGCSSPGPGTTGGGMATPVYGMPATQSPGPSTSATPPHVDPSP